MITTTDPDAQMCMNLSCLSSQFEMLSMMVESKDVAEEIDCFEHFIPEFAFAGILTNPQAATNRKGRQLMEPSPAHQKHESKVLLS